MSLWKLSAQDMYKGYITRTFSPMDVFESCLTRLKQVEPAINAMTIILNDLGQQAAEASSLRYASGKPLSRLDGVPVSIKDNILTADAPSTWGTPALKQYISCTDEIAVARAKSAGMVLLGKTNLCEFTLEGYSANPLFGVTRNPWNLDKTPGGSSGGAAASVAAGVTPLALGTDAGGSIRRPSSHCGIVGFKPSMGSVARDQTLPPVSLDFDVVGPLGRNVKDVSALFDVIAGPSSIDWRSWGPARRSLEMHSVRGRTGKIFYCDEIEDFPLDPEIQQHSVASLEVFETLGFQIDRGHLPFSLRFTTDRWPIVGQIGLSWLFREYPDWAEDASKRYKSMADIGANQSAADVIDLLRDTELLRKDVAIFFNQYDYIITPATASLPWDVEELYPKYINNRQVGSRGHAIFSAWINASGIPAIALPAGMSASNLPLGIQLVGAYGSDSCLLRTAYEYEIVRNKEYQWPSIGDH